MSFTIKKAERLIREARQAGARSRTGTDRLFMYALEVGAARNPQRVVPGGAEPVARNPVDFDREYAAIECADNSDSSANLDDAEQKFEAWSDGEPITIAVRVCGTCKRLLDPPAVIWRGDDAHHEAWCETAGLCDECFDAQMRELEAEGE